MLCNCNIVNIDCEVLSLVKALLYSPQTITDIVSLARTKKETLGCIIQEIVHTVIVIECVEKPVAKIYSSLSNTNTGLI